MDTHDAAPLPSKIPFTRAFVAGEELAYVRQVIDEGHLSGNGPFTELCCKWLERTLGCARVLLTFSCTAALEMATLLADLRPGDEVLLPSFTFPTSASAVALRGATPVFVDIRPDTLNLDERLLEGALTERTRAIMPVHYAGVACEMAEVGQLAARHGLVVIEDAAQGISAAYHGRSLGTLGDLGALSFHETKNLTCGEGGALIVNREEWVERAEILQEKGTNRSQFLRGQVDKYTWVDLGSSFLTSEVNAAFLWAQIRRAEEILARRLQIWNAYHERLRPLEEEGLLRRPIVPAGCAHNAHMYYLLLPDGERRDQLIETLAAQNIVALFHYVPLHSSLAGRRYGRAHGELPVTDRVSDTLVRLPLFNGLTDAEVQRVCAAVHAALAPAPVRLARQPPCSGRQAFKRMQRQRARQ